MAGDRGATCGVRPANRAQSIHPYRLLAKRNNAAGTAPFSGTSTLGKSVTRSSIPKGWMPSIRAGEGPLSSI